MRQRLFLILLAAIAAAGFLAAAPASAGGHVGFSVGATFPVGNGVVSLMVGQPAYGYGYGSGYGYGYPAYGRPWAAQPFYYRVAVPIAYYGSPCSSYCYTGGGYHYHHPGCPALHAYLTAYNVNPVGYWPYSWSPNWASYGWGGGGSPCNSGCGGGGYYGQGGYYDQGGYGQGGYGQGGYYDQGGDYGQGGYYGDNGGYENGYGYDSRSPAYRAPAYRAPAYRGPGYRAPQYRAPAYRAPQYRAPSYRAPLNRAQVNRAPVYRTPVYRDGRSVVSSGAVRQGGGHKADKVRARDTRKHNKDWRQRD